MSKLSFWIALLIFFTWINNNSFQVQCQYCHHDFKSFGRLLWRCKAKFEQETSGEQRLSDVTIETATNLIVNLNKNVDIRAPEKIETEYDRSVRDNSTLQSYFKGRNFRGKKLSRFRGF